ncbi:hypothetical protein [Streptomyces alfalfae]|uniref:hypothetical protein n=1 Tax=Streptomyces alfalfae TaxID=1642299 RepID=UPI0028113547|nr:hypothetical protein [Streptomyces alfalfae]
MRARTVAVTAALLIASLTACGSGDGDKPDSKPSAEGPAKQEPNDDTGAGEPRKLGEPAQTIGDGGTGVLQITPDTVVYVKEDSGEKAANGIFAVVTMKDKAMTGVAADEVAPISGGGWSWIAPDGETIGFDSGNSTMVTLDKYDGADPVQPGSWQWRSQVFDLTPAQAKGGTLIYVDGEEAAHRWKMPAADSGPNVAELKKQLAE